MFRIKVSDNDGILLYVMYAEIEECVRQLPAALHSSSPALLVDFLATVFLPEDLSTTVRLDPAKYVSLLPRFFTNDKKEQTSRFQPVLLF